MRRFAVLGNPISHSKSPAIHHAFAESCGHEIDYQKVLVEPEDFNAVVTQFFDQGGIGLNVTAPLKGNAFDLAEWRSPEAQDARAANTLWRDSEGRICAHTTDGSGLLRDLEANLGWAIADKHVLLLGAGGAMRGILGPLCNTKPASIHVANRTVETAKDLIDLFKGRCPLSAGGLGEIPDLHWDLIVNGLSSGWGGGFPDISLAGLSGTASAYDLIYSETATPFMQWAQQKGVSKISDGLGMLVEQAADSYAIWQGQRPETEMLLAQMR